MRQVWVARVLVMLLAVVAVGLLRVEQGQTRPQAAGARDACAADQAARTAPPGERSGSSIDATTQRVALAALDSAACRLGTTRERVLLTLLPDRGQPRLPIPRSELEPVVRRSLLDGLDRAQDRGEINRVVGATLRQTVRVLPLDELLNRLLGT